MSKNQNAGMSYIMAVYAALDKYLANEIKDSGVALTCGKGCAVCCYQMISCTKPEMDEIILFISRMEKGARHDLKKQLGQFAEEWEQYYSKNQLSLTQNPFLFVNDWKGKPCPFLGSDGACIIYPVRIIDCRTLSSLRKCETFETSRAQRHRFACETWANNLILDHQEDRFGYQAVSPLGHWLSICKKRNWQPIRDDELRLEGGDKSVLRSVRLGR
ncbi:MAG: hypothetical protein PHN39_03910 [Candidatus Pacebacteria bacterium]|nr:hypothetical protein [Candidatus Paceibacterota bacterium]